MEKKKILIALLGPTAIGKTSFAIEIAKYYQTEIISADSRQFYKDLNIGVAKPNALELAQVKHHFISILPLDQDYSAGEFEREAINTLDSIFKERNVAVVVGGSMLYLNSLLYGFDDLPSDKEVRSKLNLDFEIKGLSFLQNEMKRLDQEHYDSMDIHNPHRLIRALEVCIITGQKYSQLRSGNTKTRDFEIHKVGLIAQRNNVYKRINNRVDSMMIEGLLEEAKSVFACRDLNALNTVGYKELFEYFDGNCSLEQAVEKIKQHSRNFAKRQLTWWRRDTTISWIDVTSNPPSIQFVQQMISI